MEDNPNNAIQTDDVKISPTNNTIIKEDGNNIRVSLTNNNSSHNIEGANNIIININVNSNANSQGNFMVNSFQENKNGADIIFDFGKMIFNNKPVFNKDSIVSIRNSCRNSMKKLTEIKSNLDEFDEEYDKIEDVSVLFSDALTICEENRNREVFEDAAILRLTESFYKARNEFEELCKSKGW